MSACRSIDSVHNQNFDLRVKIFAAFLFLFYSLFFISLCLSFCCFDECVWSMCGLSRSRCRHARVVFDVIATRSGRSRNEKCIIIDTGGEKMDTCVCYTKIERRRSFNGWIGRLVLFLFTPRRESVSGLRGITLPWTNHVTS